MPLAIVCACIARFVSDQFENHIVCFLMTRLICYHTFLTSYCVFERASEGERILTKNFEVGFCFTLNVPVNNFSVNVGTEPTLPGFNKYSRELMCLAQGRNTVTLAGIEPRTSRFGVRRSLYIKSKYIV